MMDGTSSVEETRQLDRATVNLRLGAGLVYRIDVAAAHSNRTRNSWICDALISALAGGIPPADVTKIDYLDVAMDRLAVTVRMPRGLLIQVDRCANKADMNRTTLITYVVLGALGEGRRWGHS